jgi:hypothetical protein
MMTQKQMLDTLLDASKKYIDSIMSNYGESEKELAGFEKNYMGKYSGGAPVDHVLFRKFLRLLNELYNIDLGELLLELDKDFHEHLEDYEKENERLKAENEELRKELDKVRKIANAAL